MLRTIIVSSQIIMMSCVGVLAEETNATGQVAFNTHCRQCPTIIEGDNRLGPSLHNIFGTKAGEVAGFANYSGSLATNITWDEATLDTFLVDPVAIAPNTNMLYPGVADAAERKKIIEFLRKQSKPQRN